MKKSFIYTRTGDKGKTSLIGGTRVPKFDIRLEAYGTVDELNAHMGLLTAGMSKAEDIQFLRGIQNKLFDIGSHLATDQEKTELHRTSIILPEEIQELEERIDLMDSNLPSLKTFVLPGGTASSALAHVCRTICRRAERRILELSEKVAVSEDLICYVNRLSDFFFVLSRKLNHDADQTEIYWDTNCK